MKLRIRMTLANEAGEEFFGRGLCELLEGIGQLGSIQQAARAMELSYVKALRILQRVEREMGFAMVVRHRGGATRGGADLTERAKEFLAAYRALEAEVKAKGERAFEGFAGKWAGGRGD